jgi:drug/metabolite transporter (DMT)-like permease
MSRSAANSILLLTALIWGFGFVAQATALEKMGPVLFTALRFFVAGLVVLPFAIWEGGGKLLPRLDRRGSGAPFGRKHGSTEWGGGHWAAPVALLSGIFLLGQVTQQVGMLTTSVTNTGFLTALYVILVPIFGIGLFRQWPNPVVWPAAGVALGGTWLLGGGLDGLRAGDYWVMASAIFWALHVVLIGRVATRTGRPLFLVAAQSFVAGSVALIMALALEPVELAAIWNTVPELIVAGALSGGLGFSMQAIGQRYTKAADAAVIFSAEAVFAAAAAALLLGERLEPSGWLGCALILTAVVTVQIVPLVLGRQRRAGLETS